MRTGARQTTAVMLVVVVAARLCAGCMTTTRFPPTEVSKLRPLMAGAAPGTSRVVLRGDEDEVVEVDRDTELDLVIQFGGRPMHGLITPGRLSLRSDGLWVERNFVRASDIVGMELRTVSPGKTVGLVLGCVGGAVVTLYALFLLILLSSTPEYS